MFLIISNNPMKKLMILLTAISFLLGCENKPAEEIHEQPNFVWIMSEDNSKHYIKMFDENGIATPNIEKLAEGGVAYTRAFSNTPVCSTARTTLMTGCFGPRIGTHFHRKSKIVPMPDSVDMFPAYLRKAGYYTANNNKRDYNAECGQNVWDESSKEAHWRKRQPGQPFFYQNTFTKSHESCLHFDKDMMQTYEPRIHPDSVFVNPNHPDTELFRFTNSFYRDRMLLNDEYVGKVIRQLEEDSLLDNTFVFYFGDHGGALPGSKGYAYETGLHVPLVVRIPEKYKHLVSGEKGTTSSEFVSFVDFGPTLLKLAGLNVPDGMGGIPFLGKNIESKPVERDVAFGYADRFDEKYDLVRTARKGRFKYMRNYQGFNPNGMRNNYRYRALAYQEWRDLYAKGNLDDVQKQFFEQRPPEVLFDIDVDPYETKNLAIDPAYKEKVMEMRSLLNGWVKGMPDLSFYPESELTLEAFDNPVKFGLDHKSQIAELVDVSDLSLLSFEEAEAGIKAALLSEDPYKRYWALIVCSNFGQQASVFYDKAKELTSDPHLLVRVRSAEFLALNGVQDPKEVINDVLATTRNDIEALLALNTVVLLMDGEHEYKFNIDEKMFNEKVLEQGLVQRRLEYIVERQSQYVSL